MHHESAERRPTPRVSAETAMVMALHVAVPVRLLNLDAERLLLACRVPLRVGSTIRVAIDLPRRRLDVELCVDSVSNRPDEALGGYVLGGRLPSLEGAAWQRIAALLGARLSTASDERASWAA